MNVQGCSFASANISDDDIVIVSAVRTAIGRAKKGNFRSTHPTDLLAAALKGAVEKAGIKADLINEIVVGNVLASGGFATQSRMAMFLAGFPKETTISTCNRQCSSGIQAIVHVAAAIKSGMYEIGIGAGVESMSTADMMGSVGELNDKVFDVPLAAACLNTMGQTSENVATEFKISREKQDKLAFESNAKAIKAIKDGKFKDEIIPITVSQKGKDGSTKNVVVDTDDGPRETTLQQLQSLKPAFSEDGTTTAGNSSQVSDGASAAILMTRRKAKELSLPILGSLVSYAVTGVDPSIMGVGPASAIPAALKKANLSLSDIDVFEINEAFASQAVYCVEKLGVDRAKLNPNGGAIALGHPLGCTGARMTATLLHELKRRKGSKYGVVSMCIGTGMGFAAIYRAF